jgi:hypothetical protein
MLEALAALRAPHSYQYHSYQYNRKWMPKKKSDLFYFCQLLCFCWYMFTRNCKLLIKGQYFRFYYCCRIDFKGSNVNLNKRLYIFWYRISGKFTLCIIEKWFIVTDITAKIKQQWLSLGKPHADSDTSEQSMTLFNLVRYVGIESSCVIFLHVRTDKVIPVTLFL